MTVPCAPGTIRDVKPEDTEVLQAAVAVLNEGDIDPFVELMAVDLRWEGVSRGWLWWRRIPS